MLVWGEDVYFDETGFFLQVSGEWLKKLLLLFLLFLLLLLLLLWWCDRMESGLKNLSITLWMVECLRSKGFGYILMSNFTVAFVYKRVTDISLN